MYLRAAELKDWRSYENARFEFPIPEGTRNVILIRAPNEYGKTSFFEAVTLGLFGRDGISLVPRARSTASADLLKASRLVGYSQFIKGVLHKRALDEGRRNCSVTLDFEDSDGEPTRISRKWKYSANGEHRPADDELSVFEGHQHRPLIPPVNVSDQDAWYRDYIAQTFIPSPLAEFFLFDGEQIQRYAQNTMAKQIQKGVEGLLGLPVLRELRDTLSKYASSKRNSQLSKSDDKIEAIREEIAQLQAQIELLKKTIAEMARTLPPLEEMKARLLDQIGGRSGTSAEIASLIAEEENYRDEAERCFAELMEMIADKIALGITGVKLRKSTIQQLVAETELEEWENGRNQANRNLDRFLDNLSSRLKALQPQMEGMRRKAVMEAAREAMLELWYPVPEGCAQEYLHPGLKGAGRQQAIEHLKQIESLSALALRDLVNRREASIQAMEAKRRERLEAEKNKPEIEELTRQLEAVVSKIATCRQKRDTATRSLVAAEAKLANLQKQLGSYLDSIDRGAPEQRRAKQAEIVTVLIDEVLKEAIPSQASALSSAMTRAWKSMAQDPDRIDRIVISSDCEVSIVNTKGENIHDIEKSAGASQIFTQALIWAINHVSDEDFPFIVDTPLARLSHEHRIGVLKTFLNRKGQVILLSTDEEVVNDKYDAIRDKILAAYQLKVRHETGIPITTIEREYI